ncbi:tRNA (adenosine(37)-N6)-threonylcarbamoyltransferase complex dimerization subunit type 1 TsaB [bacterium]|nr:MAG: tRNA (adenosine(37)-N6)-threonylcarbamoyltransferase complex dimerization subunit type 1 TsaB [bacterium]
MNLLAIDTSTKYFSLAVAKDDKITARFHKPIGPGLSRLILPIIDRQLKKAGIPLNKIDCFAVGLGPGSFTGLRVGIAAIKGLAFARALPVAGIISLDVLALTQAKRDGAYICPIIDAKRKLIYSALYRRGESLKRISKYLLVSAEDLLKAIGRKDKVYFSGDAISLYRNEIVGKLGGAAVFTEESFWYPGPRELVSLAREKIRNKELDNPDKIVPFYLYPKECQISR